MRYPSCFDLCFDRISYIFLAILFCLNPIFGQRVINGLFEENHYTKVLGRGDCRNQLEVAPSSQLGAGDEVVLVQLFGARIHFSNDAHFGKLDSRFNNRIGRYEINRIRRVEGQIIHFEQEIIGEYNFSIPQVNIPGGGAIPKMEGVFLIYIPNIGDATIEKITCSSLDRINQKGGIIAFRGGRVTLKDTINLSGMGFQGGKYENVSQGGNCNTRSDYYFNSSDSKLGAAKGKNFVFSSNNNFLFPNGRGALANGGGGGNNHNFGGGGGGNYNNGGRGGHWEGCIDEDLISHGIGGHGIGQNDLLILGGGGGAGHSNNGHQYKENDIVIGRKGSEGAAGGGIFIAIVDQFVVRGVGAILANGIDVDNPIDTIKRYDGGGGGGAGGSILIITNNTPIGQPLIVQAKGGNGGSINHTHGHGGGGAGGRVLISTSSAANFAISVEGGDSGISRNRTNNANGGDRGLIALNYQPIFSSPYYPLITFDAPIIQTPCDGFVILNIDAQGAEGQMEYSINKTDWSTGGSFDSLSTGCYTIEAREKCQESSTVVCVEAIPVLGDSILQQQFRRCDSLGSFEVQSIGGQPPFDYRIIGEDWKKTSDFDQLLQGTYQFEIRDQRGCLHNDSIKIADKSSPLNLRPILRDTIVSFGEAISLFIHLNAPLSRQFKWNWTPNNYLNCQQCPTPISRPLEDLSYQVTTTDEFGCMGTANIQVRVKEPDIYLPNTFSPNGDQVNDYYTVFTAPNVIRQIISMRIFDRWGILLFERHHFAPNIESDGWDGTFKGQVLDNQVVVVELIIELWNQQHRKMHQTVTLLK